jgi:hypothetical protein
MKLLGRFRNNPSFLSWPIITISLFHWEAGNAVFEIFKVTLVFLAAAPHQSKSNSFSVSGFEFFQVSTVLHSDSHTTM